MLSYRSDNPLTQHVLGRLHTAVEREGIFLVAVQIPRELNLLSDRLSHVYRALERHRQVLPPEGLLLLSAPPRSKCKRR